MQETYVSFKNMVLYKKDLYEEERMKLKKKRTLSIHLVYSMYLHRIVGKECGCIGGKEESMEKKYGRDVKGG